MPWYGRDSPSLIQLPLHRRGNADYMFRACSIFNGDITVRTDTILCFVPRRMVFSSY